MLGPWRSVGGGELAGQLMCLGAAACYGIAIPYQRRFLSGLTGSGLAVPAGQLKARCEVVELRALLGGESGRRKRKCEQKCQEPG